MQALEDRADPARGLDDVADVLAGAARIVAGEEHGILQAFADQIVLERLLVLEVALLLAALHLVERRLGDEEMPGLDQLEAICR